jgi:hypothetical protein
MVTGKQTKWETLHALLTCAKLDTRKTEKIFSLKDTERYTEYVFFGIFITKYFVYDLHLLDFSPFDLSCWACPVSATLLSSILTYRIYKGYLI